MLAIGGVPIGKQKRTLAAGADILVATPGRLLDLANERAVSFDHVEVLVLDEADRMLDMGFIRDIRKIVAMVPDERQTLFFSATMPSEIAQLAKVMLRNPVTVAVTPAATTVELIAQRAVRAERTQKPALLAALLSEEGVERALVFTRTKHGADRVVRGLGHDGIAAQAIHGNKTQGARERTMAAFRNGDIRVLVATDIAARGIDVEGVSHVVNYDLPNVPETYVHRIGRTARAGASGIAISLVSGEEMPLLRDIEKTIRQKVPMSGEAPAAGASDEGAAQRDGRRPHRDGERRGRPAHGKPRQQHGQGERPDQRHEQRQRDDGRRHGKPPHRENQRGGKHQGHRDGQQPSRQHAHGPSRPHNGGNIGEVGFMAERPRRGGMGQGSAY